MHTSEALFPLTESPDTTLELARLMVAVHDIGVLAQRSLETRGQAATLAWLRRITYGVDHLEAAWRKTLPPPSLATPSLPRRRSADSGRASCDEAS